MQLISINFVKMWKVKERKCRFSINLNTWLKKNFLVHSSQARWQRSEPSSGIPQDEANSHPPTTPISQPYLRYLEVIYVCNFPSSPLLYEHLHHPLNPPLLYPSSLPKTFSSTQNFHFAKPQLIQPSLISCTKTPLHKVHPTSKYTE